jgi:hypothetical protein
MSILTPQVRNKHKPFFKGPVGKTEYGEPRHKSEDDAARIVDNYGVKLRTVLKWPE